MHTSVLLEESIALLDIHPDGKYIDATLGAGGHAEKMLERSSPSGRLLGLDADPRAIELAQQRLGRFVGRYVLVHTNFRYIEQAATEHDFNPCDGVLFDLGISSMQVDAWAAGFSFRRDEPLDMRFDPTSGKTAADIIRESSEQELARIIWEYGEEPKSRQIARAIKSIREPVITTVQLVQAVESVYKGKRSRIHPATRTFQALRIAVNDELDALQEGLAGALRVLRVGGRLVVISFHSLEDRIVKHFMRERSKGCICPPEQLVCTCNHRPEIKVLTRKPIVPSEEEVKVNPRSRSAKLRAAEKL